VRLSSIFSLSSSLRRCPFSTLSFFQVASFSVHLCYCASLLHLIEDAEH
jgi:hypothetical protein